MLNKIFQKYGIGKKNYVNKENCIDFIDEVYRVGFLIVGVEGLLKKDSAIVANMDEILDFSNASLHELETEVKARLLTYFENNADSDLYDFTVISADEY